MLDRGVRQGGEARGEHLRKDIKVGGCCVREQFVEVGAVGLRVAPDNIGLDQIDFHISGMRFAGRFRRMMKRSGRFVTDD